MAADKEPCGNVDCDACYPIPRWKISTESVRRVVHEREIKAATIEEALAIYSEGTEWPSAYDERTVEFMYEKPPVVASVPPTDVKFNAKWVCYHGLNDRLAEFTQAEADEDLSE